jgi:hypothetical protein
MNAKNNIGAVPIFVNGCMVIVCDTISLCISKYGLIPPLLSNLLYHKEKEICLAGFGNGSYFFFVI